ncbi:MAG TPA: endolytic transglycosylase MltG [Gemmatimonadaceae bacterium]|nr:endolytic transglycosylase MltG [Gemmatimonadaceae bacterium]
MRFALVAGCVLFAACGGEPYGAPTRVIVPRGASFRQATDSLAKAKLVGSPRMFRLYGRLTGGDRNIKPGTYLFKPGTPWTDMVSALNGGRGLVNTITIPEGYTISQITPLLARTLKVPADSVKVAMRDTAMLARLDIPNPTLEGYVFPDTYAFPIGTTARQAVREMVYAFERRWKPDWDTSLTELKINRNDLVTMASIVEKEARVAEERPVIAAVYYNRLRRGMLLQADPTIQFALGRHVGRVFYKDLEIKSPYNTYIHKGLPPGPIASPGAASLAAAAHPANVPYLYFVATRDGHHEFRMTLNEHVNAIRQVRGTAPPKKTKPLMLASAAPSKRATKATVTKSPAKTTSKATSKPATKTAVKAVPKKSTKSTATTKKKKRPTTQTTRPTTQTTSTTR